MNELQILELISSTGALGLLALLLWKAPQLVSQMLDRFQAETRYEREQCQRQFEALLTRIDSNQAILQQGLDRIEQWMEANRSCAG